jgi:hypothetical protein
MKSTKKELIVPKEIFNIIKSDYVMIYKPKLHPGYEKIIDKTCSERDRYAAAELILGEAIRQISDVGLIEPDIGSDLNYLFMEYLENAGQRSIEHFVQEFSEEYEIAEEDIY